MSKYFRDCFGGPVRSVLLVVWRRWMNIACDQSCDLFILLVLTGYFSGPHNMKYYAALKFVVFNLGCHCCIFTVRHHYLLKLQFLVPQMLFYIIKKRSEASKMYCKLHNMFTIRTESVICFSYVFKIHTNSDILFPACRWCIQIQRI